MREIVLLIVVCAIFFAGCTAQDVILRPNAENIQIGQDYPGDGYQEIGTISVKHGDSYWSVKGTYEGARNLLKNKAMSFGADYVQITNSNYEFDYYGRDHSGDGYIMKGIAYKRKMRSTDYGTTQNSSNTSGKRDTGDALEDSSISNYMQRQQVEQIQRDSQSWNQIRNGNTSFNQSMQYQTRQNYNQSMQNYNTRFNQGFK